MCDDLRDGANLLASLLLNTELLSKVVLRSFSTYWNLVNIALVAATGAPLFAGPMLGRM